MRGMDQPILELRSITKIYPGVVALDHVSLSFRRGEVHAIVGENGAGKSTFIKTITGAVEPTEGEIWFEGEKLVGNNTRLSLEKGISEVVFDRGGYLYHGRVAALAEAAREAGLKF